MLSSNSCFVLFSSSLIIEEKKEEYLLFPKDSPLYVMFGTNISLVSQYIILGHIYNYVTIYVLNEVWQLKKCDIQFIVDSIRHLIICTWTQKK